MWLAFYMFLVSSGWAQGELIGVLLDPQNLPVENASLLIQDSKGNRQEIWSDRFGSFSVPLDTGLYGIEVRFQEMEWKGEFKIIDQQQTELLLQLSPNPIILSLEQPKIDNKVEDQISDKEIPLVKLEGEVFDNNGKPLSGVKIVVQGVAQSITSNSKGYFHSKLPQKVYSIAAIKRGYLTQKIDKVRIPNKIQFKLIKAGLQLEDFTVTAPRILGSTAALLADRQKTSTVKEVLAAEQMSKSGDSSAAAALKRVTGLTVLGGKYVFVRGLGERYSASILNGSSLPSPEPERRVVPLDMFPTSVLESISIQKTFSPDMQAEFGGGIISLQTRSIPEKPFVTLKTSGSFIDGTTFQVGQAGFRGARDFLGFDTGARSLPEEVANASSDSRLEEGDMFSFGGYSADELERFGEMIPNHWTIRSQKTLPNMGLMGAAGSRWMLGGGDFGVLGSVLWKNAWDYNDFKRNYFILGQEKELELSHVYRFETLKNNVRLGGSLNLAYEKGGQKINSVTLLNRSSLFETRTYQGENRDVGDDIRVTRIGWKERQLFFQQFHGEHEINQNNYLDWRYALSIAQRLEPDRREFRYDNEPSTDLWYLSNRPEGNSIFYSTLNDTVHSTSIDWRFQFQSFQSTRESVFKNGVAIGIRNRQVDTRRFKYMHKGERSNASEVLSLEPDKVFTTENIGSDGFQFEEVTRETDNYNATLDTFAVYSMLDAKVRKRWTLLGGVRMEMTTQNVSTFELFNPNMQPVEANLENLDFLPAFTATYDLGPDEDPETMRLRFGYGRTLSRPDFRELSPATFNDVTGGRQVYGNPDLKRALIDNIDTRWEWYFAPMQSLSFGAFAKRFYNPIESIVVVSAQHSVTYQNADSAQNYGIETDFRKSLDFLGYDDLYFGGNAAWIRSRVQLSDNVGIQTSNNRALEGQSPYVYNMQFSYEHPDDRGSLALFYNVFGPRITEVGALGAPDSVEDSIHRVDMVGRFRFEGFMLGFQMKNLLDWPAIQRTGDREMERQFNGRSVHLGLQWTQ